MEPADVAELKILRVVTKDLIRDQVQQIRVLNVMLALCETEIATREASDDKAVKTGAVIWRTARLLCSDAIQQAKKTQVIHDQPTIEASK